MKHGHTKAAARCVLVAALAANILLLSCPLLSILEVLGVLEATGSPWMSATFSVRNLSPHPIVLTPVGRVRGNEDLIVPLPVVEQAANRYSEQRAAFAVRPGETLTIAYDYDDVILSHLVIGDSNGTQLQFDVYATVKGSESNHFTFDVEAAILLPATPAVRHAAAEAEHHETGTLPKFFLLPLLTLPILLWALRTGRAASPSTPT